MKKKLIIIFSILIFTAILAVTAVFITFHTIDYFAGTVEKSFNISLSDLSKNMSKDKKISLSYQPFQCYGRRSIFCSGDDILVKYKKMKFEVKDIKFTLTPYYDNADISLKGRAVYKTIVDDKERTLPMNFECYGNYKLLADETMIKTRYWCNTYVNYLKTHQQSTVYFQNKHFDESSIYGFAKKFDEFILNNQFQKAVYPTKAALVKYQGYIESKDLFEEYLNIIKRFDPNYLNSKEQAIMSLPSYKTYLFFISVVFGRESAVYAVYDKIMQSLKNVLEKDYNKIAVTLRSNKDVPVKALLFSPKEAKEKAKYFSDKKYYTFDVKSSKVK